MPKSLLEEAAKEMFAGNIANKKGQEDKPKKLEGEVQDLGGSTPTHVLSPEEKPDAAQGLSQNSLPHSNMNSGDRKGKKLDKSILPEDADKPAADTVDEDKTEIDESGHADKAIAQHKAGAKPAPAAGTKADFKAKMLAKMKARKTVKEGEEEDIKEATVVTSIDEDMVAMFEGEELTEGFKSKASTIFEAAVNLRVKAISEELEGVYSEAANEYVAEITEALTKTVSEQVDEYLSFMVNEWMESNKVAIDTQLRNELTQDFISGLKNLFAEHYIDVPEDKIDVIEELTSKVETLEAQVNEEIASKKALHEELSEYKKYEVIFEATADLSDVARDKVIALAESLEFKSLDNFKSQVETLKETYAKAETPKSGKNINEELVQDKEELDEEVKKNQSEKVTSKSTDPTVDVYASVLGKYNR